jgi:hypothetical protein
VGPVTATSPGSVARQAGSRSAADFVPGSSVAGSGGSADS